jgi:hypothetical protein
LLSRRFWPFLFKSAPFDITLRAATNKICSEINEDAPDFAAIVVAADVMGV